MENEISLTILGPPDYDLEPLGYSPMRGWEAVEAEVEGALATGDYDHGEAVDLVTGERRFFYREYRVVWEEVEA